MIPLFIPFKDYERKIGGPSTFMRNLHDYFLVEGFKTLSKPINLGKTSGIFFPISYDKYILSIFRDKGLPIIQRLDGIYYPSKHGKKYLELNRDIKDIYDNYSTYKIFQSDYCRDQVFEIFSPIGKDCYTIIHNGADNDIFFPSKETGKDNSGFFKLITTGNFRNPDMLEPILKALDSLNSDYDFELLVVGPLMRNLKPLIKRSYIKHIRKARLGKVSKLLRGSDIFIYSHLNPPCPNSVIEAISCGLPVVGFESGSMKELLFFAKDLLAFVSDEVIQQYRDFDHRSLREKILYTFENFEVVKKRALKYHNLYPFSNTGKKYIEILKDQIKKQTN